jgi:hypothetical protein
VKFVVLPTYLPKSRFFGYRKPVFRIYLSVGRLFVRVAALFGDFLEAPRMAGKPVLISVGPCLD